MNKSDSERVAEYLENLGYQESSRTEADLVVITTCGVRQSAEDRIYGLIPGIKKSNPNARIILTGCLSERGDIKKKLAGKVDIWLPIRELPHLDAWLEDKIDSKPLGGEQYLNLPAKHSSGFSAFIPIGNGCDNYCAYCVVPYARGSEVYRPAQDIADEAKELIKKGYKEINLIAQNVNSYKSNQAGGNIVDFAALLRMINDIPGDFWIRFATSHPKDMSVGLISAVAECEKVCEHIHLPVQAGDDKVLQAMNRHYTVKHYRRLIKKIRDILDKPASKEKGAGAWRSPTAITTDIIVGFPGETREQFDNTKKLFEKIKFDMAYIARYSPRPQTSAGKLQDNVSKGEKKKREEELTTILRKTARKINQEYIGHIVPVMIFGRAKTGEIIVRTRTGKNVKIHLSKAGAKNRLNPGQIIKAKIIKAGDFSLAGELDE